VFAVRPTAEALAFARPLVPVDVDVVDLPSGFQANLLDPEAAAEVRRDGERR
jgi:hypothetical protein